MENEIINQKQAVLLLSAFIVGTSSIIGIGGEYSPDIWLSILTAIVMASLIFFVYARIVRLFPGMGLFQLFDILFGKITGRIISIIFVWYAFHLSALIIRDAIDFVYIVSLVETPIGFLAVFLTTSMIFAVRSGIEVIGRWVCIIFPFTVFTYLVITGFSIPLYDIRNLEPMLYNGFKPVFDTAFSVFAFPFAEAVLFLEVMGNLRKNTSPYKVYFLSLFIGGIIILIISIRTLLIFGTANAKIFLFPSYSAIKLINIRDFIQRIEIMVSTTLIINAFVKCSVCFYVTTKGIAHILNIRDYHKIVAPVGLLTALFSIVIFDNILQLVEWTADIYKYYAFLFQVILPVIIWITAEIKSRIFKKNEQLQSKNNNAS